MKPATCRSADLATMPAALVHQEAAQSCSGSVRNDWLLEERNRRSSNLSRVVVGIARHTHDPDDREPSADARRNRALRDLDSHLGGYGLDDAHAPAANEIPLAHPDHQVA